MQISALLVDDSPIAIQIVCYHRHAAGCVVVGEAGGASN
jgi:hypothetical protein